MNSFSINNVVFNMIKVPGGSFTMGNNCSKEDERPEHLVTLSEFYLSETLVTQELWLAVMANNPSGFKGSLNPVENITWYEAILFTQRLSDMVGSNFTLPTEAQWEYAARLGGWTPSEFSEDSKELHKMGWFYGSNCSKTMPVKLKAANELGIYDMPGNVEEWCLDWYDSYPEEPQVDPAINEDWDYGYKVLRGGSIYDDPRSVTARSNLDPILKYDHVGFRLACYL